MHLSRRSQRTAWRPQALANCSDCPAGNRGVLTRHLSPSTLPGAGSFGLHPHSRFDPALKQIDLLVRPGSIAWHRAAAQPPQDGVGMCANVVVRPEIKRDVIERWSRSRKSGLMSASKLGLSAKSTATVEACYFSAG
jgi:hypothetical protein